MQQQALFWKSLKNRSTLQCTLCPRYCVIAEGDYGYCQVRKNQQGVLQAMQYGECLAIAVDPIEKKPLAQFHPKTKVFSVGFLGCNMRCLHCQNYHLSQDYSPKQTTFLSPLNLVDSALMAGCQGIAFTYNEPTIHYEFTLNSSEIAKEQGLYTVYVTNGYINEEPLRQLAPFLDAYCLDIKGFSNTFHQEICDVKDMAPILASATLARELGLHLEIVTNMIPGYNDDEKQLLDLATWLKAKLGQDTVWHLTRFFPYNKLTNLAPTPLASLERAPKIGQQIGLKNIILGNI